MSSIEKVKRLRMEVDLDINDVTKAVIKPLRFNFKLTDLDTGASLLIDELIASSLTKEYKSLIDSYYKLNNEI